MNAYLARMTKKELVAMVASLSSALSEGNRIIQEKNAVIAELQREVCLQDGRLSVLKTRVRAAEAAA